MATTYATIQNRRGAYDNYDPTKQVEGEFAIVKSGDPNTKDGRAVYVHFASGNTGKKRLITEDEFAPQMIEIQEAVDVTTEKARHATEQATKSQSYAVGGTSSRPGEDTDNSKYYCEESHKYNTDIHDAIDRTIPTVSIDFRTGILSYTGSFFDFIIDKTTGQLVWRLA